MSQQFYSSQGRPIVLGPKLGQGGEGAVFEVSGQTGLVAKVYHKAVSVERAAKLNAMVTLKTDRLLNLSAWPIDTLHESSGRAVKGFVMPKVTGHRDIHILYGIKTRHAEYPDARWPFLLQAAANVARAFSVIHEHHHVIGDVNQGGVVVSRSATVRLVDCDSFQITTSRNRYLCEVGVATHTPPELQGRSFKGVVRTQDHDGFGLAVIIFQLLFMGRHPFSGGFLGGGDMPLEKAILQNRFAYGPGASARQMRQPPATLQLEAVSNPLVNLFERAFLSRGNRPRAQEWITPLEQLAKNLKQCSQNSGHSFLSTLNSCPWCSIESRSGVVVFFPIYVTGTATATGAFNISAIWSQIASVFAPGPPQSLPVKSSSFVIPSAKATEIKQARHTRSYIGTIALVIACITVLVLPGSGCATFFLILLATIAAGAFVRSGEDEDAQKLQQIKLDAERAWIDIQRRWQVQHTDQRFNSKLKELDAKKTEYQNLPGVQQRKLQQLQKEVQQRQLERFLDGYRIDKARISGIGHARQITLRSYGLETAADITVSAVVAVPGFGQAYATKLLAWRYSLEKKFVFDPRRGVDPHDKRNVEMEIQTRRAKLEQDLRSGVVVLRQISDQVQSAQSGLRKSADIALKNLVQAEVDLAAGSATATLIPIVVVFVLSIWAIVFLRTGASEPTPSFSYSSNSSVTRPSPATQADGPVVLSPAQVTAHAQSAYDKGVALSKAKKFSEAETAYVQATTLKPEFADAHHELGFVRFKLKRYDDSLVALNQAYTQRPGYAETSRLLGQVYEAKENWREAAKYYGEAATLQPKHAQTHFNWSRALKNSGSLDLSIKAMLNAVKLKPEWAAAHYELALLYVAAGESESAREQYEILLTLDQGLAEKLAAKLYE